MNEEIKIPALKKYLFFKGIKVKDFAKKIGYKYQGISTYMTGKTRISVHLAKAISQGTEGELSIDQILADNAPKGTGYYYKKRHEAKDEI